MFSSPYPTSEEVVDELGDRFLEAAAGTVGAARIDLGEMREWRPAWFPTMHSRCLSNLLHDRVWSHLVARVESDPAANVIERGPTREIAIGTHLRLRIKRHHIGDKISTYPTRTAIEFWRQNNDTLPGLEEVRVAVGYRWDPDARQVGAPVLSLRDGTDNVIWAIELSEPAAGEKVTWTPIEPTLPTIDLGELGAEIDDEGEKSSG
jgi:hypothetical protein